MATTEISLAKAYKPLFDTKWRHIVFHGGRSSGKSTATAYALLLRGRQSKLRILCTREFQNSIRDSVHKLLADIIDRHGFTDYEVQRETIINKLTGTEFIFKGLRKDSQAIKSLEGIDIAWTEEAQTISKGSIDILIPTIRKDGSQLIWTFNRIHELDPVYVELCLNQNEDTYVAQVNSDTLEEIGQLPQVMIDEREKMKRNEPALYAHVWLGQPLAQGENSIIGREAILEAMNREVDDDGSIEVGVDVARMGNDRTEFVMRKGWKEVARKTFNKLRTTEVCDEIESFVDYDKNGYKCSVCEAFSINEENLKHKKEECEGVVSGYIGTLIKVDDTGVGGGVTDDMIKRGYNVMAINFGAKAADPDKYPNLISEAWFHMASIMDSISLHRDNDLLMELSSRKWVMDSKGRRGVESKDQYKKRGFRSPDKADATILCFYTPEIKQTEWASADMF